MKWTTGSQVVWDGAHTHTGFFKMVVANGIWFATQLWTLNQLLVRLTAPKVRLKVKGELWVNAVRNYYFAKSCIYFNYAHSYIYILLRHDWETIHTATMPNLHCAKQQGSNLHTFCLRKWSKLYSVWLHVKGGTQCLDRMETGNSSCHSIRFGTNLYDHTWCKRHSVTRVCPWCGKEL